VKLRALVVEDEWTARNYLVELLHASNAVDVVGAVADLDGARQVLESPSGEAAIDVAFIDVQLAGSERDDDGLALVRDYLARPGAPLFVLATAFRVHALEAYDLGVVDYLLKPFSEERVARCLDRVRQHRPLAARPAAPPSRLVARRKRALVFVRLDEVWAFEAADRLAYVHTARGRFEIDLSLSAIEVSFGSRCCARIATGWSTSITSWSSRATAATPSCWSAHGATATTAFASPWRATACKRCARRCSATPWAFARADGR